MTNSVLSHNTTGFAPPKAKVDPFQTTITELEIAECVVEIPLAPALRFLYLLGVCVLTVALPATVDSGTIVILRVGFRAVASATPFAHICPRKSIAMMVLILVMPVVTVPATPTDVLGLVTVRPTRTMAALVLVPPLLPDSSLLRSMEVLADELPADTAVILRLRLTLALATVKL